MTLQALKKLNYQYEVTTGLYMMESWEKYIINSIFLGSFLLLSYATLSHLPDPRGFSFQNIGV